MSAQQRLRGFWDSVRPRPRRGGILAVVAILGGAAALSVALFAGAAMAWNPYLDYTLNSDVNARQWAVLPLSYTASSTCAECHADQQTRLTSATHEGIGCQSCHGASGHGTTTLPRLAGQNAIYLELQIKQFNTRERTNDNEVMHAIASKMSELEIKAVSEYLSGQP